MLSVKIGHGRQGFVRIIIAVNCDGKFPEMGGARYAIGVVVQVSGDGFQQVGDFLFIEGQTQPIARDAWRQRVQHRREPRKGFRGGGLLGL